MRYAMTTVADLDVENTYASYIIFTQAEVGTC